MQQLIRSVDPVTFEILSHRLHQITREMAHRARTYRRNGQHHAAARLYDIPLPARRRNSLRR